MTVRRYVQRVHPMLSYLLSRLGGTPAGEDLRQRSVTVSTSTLVSDAVNRSAALAPHQWLLDRAIGQGITLTAADYLKPADARALAGVMPTMNDWPWAGTREVDAHPVLHFRDYLKNIGLLRRYKTTLRLTRVGREAQADPERLWHHLADTLVPTASSFTEQASVLIMVTMATSEGRIDVDAVARTMTEVGWSQKSGGSVDSRDIYPVWNDLWNSLGNVGALVEGTRRRDRNLSTAAQALVHDALFEQVDTSAAGIEPNDDNVALPRH